MKHLLPGLLTALFAFLVVSCNAGPAATETETTTRTTTTEPVAPVIPVPPPSLLTQANLDRVLDGMSSADVEAILGTPASSRSEPIPIIGGTQTTFTYISGSSSATIVFKNDQVKEKNGSFNP